MKDIKSGMRDAESEQAVVFTDDQSVCWSKNEREHSLPRQEIKNYIKSSASAGKVRHTSQENESSVPPCSKVSQKKSGSHSLASLQHFKTFR